MALGGIMPPNPVSEFSGSYASLPAAMLKPPVEGNRTIPVNIIWLEDAAAPGYTVEFNAAARQTTPLSQICALYVDNTNCKATVVIVFADTNFEITVAANTAGFFPIITNGLRFQIWPKLVPSAQDQTLIEVLNFLPPALGYSSAPGGSSGGDGSGTVVQVDTTAPITGGPITEQGTIGLQVPLPVTFGGTGAVLATTALANLGGAPIASPAFTGQPSVQYTPPLNSNTVNIPNTAWVQLLLGTTGLTNLGPPSVFSPLGIPVLLGQGPGPIANSAAFAVDDPTGSLWLTAIGPSNAGAASVVPVLNANSANGTPSAPTAVTSGDFLGGINCAGYLTSAWAQDNKAQFFCQATQNWTDTQAGCDWVMKVTRYNQQGLDSNALIYDGGLYFQGVAGASVGVAYINASGYYVSGAPSMVALDTKLSSEEKATMWSRTLEYDPDATPPVLPMQVGETGIAILCINDSEGFQIQNVTLGAPDSGGPGFRCLRVPN